MKSAVIVFPGINRDRDMATALARFTGRAPEMVWQTETVLPPDLDKLDKDRFRRDMGGLVEAYQEVARRLGIIPDSEQPERSRPVLVKTD